MPFTLAVAILYNIKTNSQDVKKGIHTGQSHALHAECPKPHGRHSRPLLEHSHFGGSIDAVQDTYH